MAFDWIAPSMEKCRVLQEDVRFRSFIDQEGQI
jgi:hypothetical protein